jgi:hypothetical protein
MRRRLFVASLTLNSSLFLHLYTHISCLMHTNVIKSVSLEKCAFIEAKETEQMLRKRLQCNSNQLMWPMRTIRIYFKH